MHRVLLFIIITSILACQPTQDLSNIQGVYVTVGYQQRLDGSDWISATISPLNQTEAEISIRSRADIKKPTCTFVSKATLVQANVLRATIEEKPLLFTFSKDQLKISTENKQDSDFLYFFCTNNTSLDQDYIKLTSPFDEQQLTKADYQKTLEWKDLSFNLMAIKKSSRGTLTITVDGLSAENNKVKSQYRGEIYNAELTDLDQDSWPELITYYQSSKSDESTMASVHSVINGQSISEVVIPHIWDNPKIGLDYLGFNKFSIKDNTLIQTFPNYSPEGRPTNKQTEVRYKMVEGPERKVIVADQINEF